MPTKKASIVKSQKGSLKNNIVNMEEIKQKGRFEFVGPLKKEGVIGGLRPPKIEFFFCIFKEGINYKSY